MSGHAGEASDLASEVALSETSANAGVSCARSGLLLRCLSLNAATDLHRRGLKCESKLAFDAVAVAPADVIHNFYSK